MTTAWIDRAARLMDAPSGLIHPDSSRPDSSRAATLRAAATSCSVASLAATARAAVARSAAEDARHFTPACVGSARPMVSSLAADHG